MAARKSTTNIAEAAGVSTNTTPDRPTREQVFQAMTLVARKTNRVPTAIGPTASGKTFGLNLLARQNDAEVVTVLLAQHTPDEVAGFQLNLNGELKLQLPYWYTEAQAILDRGKSVWLLFDELGLARSETYGVLLTFFRDRHLHGHTLTPPRGKEVLVFAASNAATFTPTFRSRCVFFNIPSDQDYLRTIAKGDFARRAVSLAPYHDDSDPFYSNAEPPSPVVMDASATKALSDLTNDKEFWQLEEPGRYAILAGLVPHQTLAMLLKEHTLDASVLAKNWQELLRALRALPTDKMHSMIGNVLESFGSLDKTQRADAILSVLDAVYDDLEGDDLQTYFSTPRSEGVVSAVNEIDAEYLEGQLKARELLWVEEDKQGNTKVKGSLAERIDVMAQRQAARAAKK